MIRTLLRNKQTRWALGCAVLAFTIAVIMLVSTGSFVQAQASTLKKDAHRGVVGSRPTLPPAPGSSSRAIAQNVPVPAKPGSRMMWSVPTDVIGNKLDPLSPAYKQSLDKGISLKGRSAILDTDLKIKLETMQAGDTVELPLFDGEIVQGQVNLVQEDRGATRVGGELKENSVGSFSLSKVNGRIRAEVLLRDQQLAYVISQTEDGQLALVEQPLSSLICMPYPLGTGGTAKTAQGAVLVPILSSRPDATAVIFLDFDGATITDPDWNNGRTFVAPPFDLTEEEIEEAWSLVKEDFLPFNVDVTTNAARYDQAPVGRRMRVIITSNDVALPKSGGVAYLGSFAEAGSSFSSTIPCFVFNSAPRDIGEAASHEAGHTLGLVHDSQSNPFVEYYEGGGTGATSWAPIMGAGYDKGLTQWSKGEYPRAFNERVPGLDYEANGLQDDLKIIASPTNGFGYANDPVGDSYLTPAILTRDGAIINEEEIIGRTGDRDVYAFSTGECTINISALPNPTSTNVDLYMTLRDSSGVSLAVANPLDETEASLSYHVPGGLYFLEITGTGQGNPSVDGYSNYGSLGDFSLSGTIPGELLPPVFVGPTEVSGVAGQFLTYRATATSAESYEVDGNLPLGLTLDPTTGVISGVPRFSGVSNVNLTAFNSAGTATRSIIFRFGDPLPPVLTGASTAEGIVGTPFQYQILATNFPLIYGSSPLPKGLVLNQATGLITGVPQVANVTSVTLNASNTGGTAFQTITIRVVASASVLAVAVDANTGIWTTGGAAPWKVTPKGRSFDQVDAARSGQIGNDKISWLQTQVTGPATVTFRWGVDSEAGYDRLIFTIDAVNYAAISGTTGGRVPRWRMRSFKIPAGQHTLRWTYRKDFVTAAGTDAGYVDTVTFTP